MTTTIVIDDPLAPTAPVMPGLAPFLEHLHQRIADSVGIPAVILSGGVVGAAPWDGALYDKYAEAVREQQVEASRGNARQLGQLARQAAKAANFGFLYGTSDDWINHYTYREMQSPNCRCCVVHWRNECPSDVARRLADARPSGPCSRLFSVGAWTDVATGVAHGVVLTDAERNSNVPRGAMLPACRAKITHEVGHGRYKTKRQGVPRGLWSAATLVDVTCEGCFPKIERAMLRHARRYG